MGSSHGKSSQIMVTAENSDYLRRRQHYRGLSNKSQAILDQTLLSELSEFTPAFPQSSVDYHRKLRGSSQSLPFSNSSPNKLKKSPSIQREYGAVAHNENFKMRPSFLRPPSVRNADRLELPSNTRQCSLSPPTQLPKRKTVWNYGEAIKITHPDSRMIGNSEMDISSVSPVLTKADDSHSGDKGSLQMRFPSSPNANFGGRTKDTQTSECDLSSGLNGPTQNEMSTGDVVDVFKTVPNRRRKMPSEERSVNRLQSKPPTSPPKVSSAKNQSVTLRRPPHPATSGSNFQVCELGNKPVSPTRLSTSQIGSRSTSMRSTSLPRPSTAEGWNRSQTERANLDNLFTPRRSSSGSHRSESELTTEKQQCPSRIEYTFYICDSEAYQRPFYDRRVEAIARASQCTVALHKPPPGHKPVYYKGIRVLPVTIASRTMVGLKRCIARLDMQYPYFNVKAFCPPDMY